MLTLLKSDFNQSMMYILTFPLNAAPNSYPNGIDVPYVNRRLLKAFSMHVFLTTKSMLYVLCDPKLLKSGSHLFPEKPNFIPL